MLTYVLLGSVVFAEMASTTTPICQITDGMDSPTTIPSSQISVNDIRGDVEKLRPSSEVPFETSVPTFIVEYTPTEEKPVKEVKLVSADNIKAFTVKFFNADNTVTIRKVFLIKRNDNSQSKM